MKSIFPDSLTLCNLRINGVHVSKSFEGHVETTIEEGDVFDPGELGETCSDDQEGGVIVSIVDQSTQTTQIDGNVRIAGLERRDARGRAKE
jgi:hypothetical protein